MRLTVLGSSPSWPNPGEASSGYLVETSRGRLLLDCGNGVLGRLRAVSDAPVTGIVLSHLDPDHISDLWSVMFGVRYGPLAWSGVTTLYAPPGGRVVLDEILGGFGLRLRDLEQALAVTEYRTTIPLPVAGATLTFARTRHSSHSYATRIDDAGVVLVYTGDASLTPGLAEHARDADLLLAEATYALQAPDPTAVHMTAAETAGMARDAGARRLVLTHLAAEDRDGSLAAARAIHADTELALPGAVFDF